MLKDELFVWIDAHAKCEESAEIIKAAVDRYTSALLREQLVQMFSKEQQLFATTNNDSTSYGASMNMNAIKIVLSLIDDFQ